MSDQRSLYLRIRMTCLRHRRLLAALLIGLGALICVQAAAPAAPTTTPVVVASADLNAGERLSASDLVVKHMPADLVPGGAARAQRSLLGRRIAAPVRAGEPITDRRVVGAALVAGYPSGTVAAPVRVSDSGAVALLSVGDHVNVYAAAERGRSVGPIVDDATVVALPAADADSETVSSTSSSTALVVLAVTSEQAADLTDAAASTPLGIALRR